MKKFYFTLLFPLVISACSSNDSATWQDRDNNKFFNSDKSILAAKANCDFNKSIKRSHQLTLSLTKSPVYRQKKDSETEQDYKAARHQATINYLNNQADTKSKSNSLAKAAYHCMAKQGFKKIS
ncbi:hypothetical protein [Thalassotalea hakodatensis]|uniref:hypothetical protein n=1 Tax=Thalassotalea hakodatensis TaxID=3030492 RepID=UPI00257225A1|nr:hypothetical protein [Thalassotalea hakodatensis]